MEFTIKNKGTNIEYIKLQEEYDLKIREIVNNIKNSKPFITKLEQLKLAFEWFKRNVVYDNAIFEQPRTKTGNYSANIYYPYKNSEISITDKLAPILVGKGVCKSFSLAFKDICDLLNITCKVISTSDEVVPSNSHFKKYAHAWNEIYINGETKTIDLDPHFETFMGERRTKPKFEIKQHEF